MKDGRNKTSDVGENWHSVAGLSRIGEEMIDKEKNILLPEEG